MNPQIIQGVFSLLSLAISRRKSDISVEMPSIEDLETKVQGIYASKTPKELSALGEVPYKPLEPSEKATAIATGCVPCSVNHLGTCSGLLNEAMRFARSDGVQSEEVIDRVGMCMDELAALIRVDLRPEMTVNLSSKDKELADEILVGSRNIVHKLEGISNVADLEQIAAEAQGLRRRIGKEWFQQRLSQISPVANEK
jgi:hypothetical protein